MKIILLDKRNRFRDDVRTRLLIDDERNVELVTDLADSNNLMSAITRYQPELIVVADNVYTERSAWGTCGVPVVGYFTTSLGGDIFDRDNIPHFPQIASASHLLNLLEAGIPSVKPAQQTAPQSAPSVMPTTNSTPNYHQNTPVIPPEAPAVESTSMPTGFPMPNGVAPSGGYSPQSPIETHSASVRNERRTFDSAPYNVAQSTVHVAQPAYDPNAMFTPLGGNNPLQVAPQPVRNEQPTPAYPQHAFPGQSKQAAHATPARAQSYDPAPVYAPPQSTPSYQHPGYPTTAKNQLDEQRIERNTATYASSVLEDIAIKNTPTKTVAVYSAKGGVGKTTITTELATILSMTSNGRGNYRVCLVDYNVDFGDILTTLNLNSRGPNLTHWAADVRRRMQGGESADDIQYGKKEIEGRLQRVGNSTLYALVAPVTHEDSMDLRSEEPGIILRNIVENGGFDFVICDTGNNTRDATVSALDAADVIFLIATQDVSAVNCDKSFLQTMHRVGFDVDKIRLIMNGVMPYKYTQVSVEEVENMFPYPCIARFKRDPEVTRANNCSEPIVRNPNHEFTKEMRKIVAHLTGNPIPQEKYKGGIFSIFKKKG